MVFFVIFLTFFLYLQNNSFPLATYLQRNLVFASEKKPINLCLKCALNE